MMSWIEPGAAGNAFSGIAGASSSNGLWRTIPTSMTVHTACRVAEDRTRNSDKPRNVATAKARTRNAAPASCGTRSIDIMFLPAAILTVSQFLRQIRQASQFLSIEKLSVDHPHDQLLDGAAAESFDDLLNCRYG